jgi:hypothetical protein
MLRLFSVLGSDHRTCRVNEAPAKKSPLNTSHGCDAARSRISTLAAAALQALGYTKAGQHAHGEQDA